MPDPPDVSLFTRYILENPYPLGILLLALGGVIAWLGLRDGRMDRLRLGVIPLVLGGGVLATGLLVVTSGEQARRVSRQLVDAAVTGDLVGATRQFAPEATLHFGAPTNAGFDLDDITAGLSRLDDAYTIDSNRITMLNGYTESSDAATVHLACWTETAGYGGPTPSQWVVRVERQGDGTWKITRLTCVSVAGRTPSTRWVGN